MLITEDDKILIENLFTLKGYIAKQLARQFPNKGWNIHSIQKLLQKLRVTDSVTVNTAAADDATYRHS